MASVTRAWHLRQDGKAFPVSIHLYTMDDEDLSSEAEVSCFLIKTDSKDQELAKYVLDAWMAMLIEDCVDFDADADGIRETIANKISKLPYKFPYPLTVDELIDIHDSQNNYSDVGGLYDFVDYVRADLQNIQKAITHSINQQFCRVRFGGKYNSREGNSGIWFRISSVGYNWANTIYMFTSEMKKRLGIQTITICRDPESDNGYIEDVDEVEYFYKAKDGAVYYQMDVDEFLREDHEHSLVFSATELNKGILSTIRTCLTKGETFDMIMASLANSGISLSGSYNPEKVWSYMVRGECSHCITSSEWSDNLHTRTGTKINKVKKLISKQFPEISVVDIDYKPRANNAGNMVGFELLFTLESAVEALDHIVIGVVSTKELGSVSAETLARLFRLEYKDYLEFKEIELN